MKKKLLLALLSVELYALSMSTGTSIAYEIIELFFGRMNDVFKDAPPFDSWETYIDDNTPPEKDDRNITTKQFDKPFIISLASLNFDNSDYVLKEKGDGTNHNLEIAIASNDTIISNTIVWDPTENDHVDSSELTPTQATQDAQLRYYMCASVDDPNSLADMIKKFIEMMMSGEPFDIISFLKFFFATHQIKIHALDSDSCKNKTEVKDCTFSSSPELIECFSTDHFSVKPQKLSFTLPTYVKSAHTQDINITTDAIGYTFSKTDDYNFSATFTKYMPNNEINASLAGNGTFLLDGFTNGNATNANFNFDDIAKINIALTDESWTAIDENDTKASCTERLLCGDTNVTIIPDHFTFDEAKLHNQADQNFTYIANENSMQAHIALKIQAQNEKNSTTLNFDAQSWEKSVSIRFNTPRNDESNKTQITTQLLGFSQGVYTLTYDDMTDQKHLSFNYKREKQTAQNPFIIEGKDINLTLYSLYDNDNNITAETALEQNATFLYARVHSPRTRIANNEGNASVFYEIYCQTDTNSQCNKNLLPDRFSSTFNDDPRWYNNSQHIASFGNAGVTSQKRIGDVSVIHSSTGNLPDSVILRYSGSSFPYKTTMQHQPSAWLIYNKYNASATTNEFEVEFEGGATEWVGKVEDENNVTSTDKGTRVPRTNRRTLW